MSRRRHQIWIGAFVALLIFLFAAPSAGAAGPSWSFETSNYDFGGTLAGGGPSAPHEFTLTNTGDETITVSKLIIGVGVKGTFERTESTCGKAVLEPGASCHVSVAFNPTTTGRKTGYLKAEAVNGVPPLTEVEFEGEGTGPTVSVKAGRLEFGSIPEGATSMQTLTVENLGPGTLQIYGVSAATWDYWESTLEYPSVTPYVLKGGTCREGLDLAVSANCTMEVAFTPSKLGRFGSILLIEDNGSGGSPQQIQMEGRGIVPPPAPPTTGSSSTASSSGSSSGQSEALPPAPTPTAEAAHHGYEPPARLWGDYVVSKVSVGGGATPFAKVSKVTVELEEGAGQEGSESHGIGWKARCNSAGGGLRVTSRRLIPSKLMSTLIECPDREGSEDRWLDRFFAADPTWHLKGRQLILKAGKKTLWLHRSGA